MAYYNEPIQDMEEYQLAVGGVYDEKKAEEANAKLQAGVKPYATDALIKPCIERLVLLRQIKRIIHTVDTNSTGSSLLHDTLRGWKNNRPDVEVWTGTYSNPKFGNFVKAHASYLAIKIENNKFIRVSQMETSQAGYIGHKLWKEFLTRWPLEIVEAMTLPEFHTASDPTKDNFVNWLEIRTETLGSVWGGSGFKFGIYNRNKKDAKENASGRSYTDNYGWYTKYGKSPEEAFEKVKAIILRIIKAAQRGDTTTIESIDFSPAIKWKIAFLYQPQDALFMPCIYKLEMLKLCKGYQPQLKAFNMIYEEIMKYRQGEDILRFSYGLLQNSRENISRGETIVSPLNQIFYGPPGTGKTFHTIDAALKILDPSSLELSREAQKVRFDELVAEGKICFVTFHQSFSYEDFVEGLRPVVDESGTISYEVRTGVFKELCKKSARQVKEENTFKAGMKIGNYTIEKVSKELLVLCKPKAESELPLPFSIINELASLVLDGLITIDDIVAKTVFEELTKKNINTKMEKFFVGGYPQLFGSIVERVLGSISNEQKMTTPHVLIIDEINRGNISGIFGELITLIEPSKRAGANEALTVQLPYSGEAFSVPDNLYIIGTMNTADRSLTGLDIALRRRFSFTEMPPIPDLLEKKKVKGTDITLSKVLEVMNARIELLLDRDHCLGHAPFMHLEDGDVSADKLEPVFAGVVVPFLQEYFFDDWHKIQLVLNDHQKSPVNQLIKEKTASYLAGMEEYANRKLWELNYEALHLVDFYTGIVSVQNQAVFAEELDE